jgi:agmatine deiminase
VAREAMETLRNARDARGRAFDIQRIHQPPPMTMSAGEAAGIDRIEGSRPRLAGDPLAASYVNAYVGNRVVVIPAFDEAMDERARAAYAALHPDRAIVQIPAREIVLGGGGIHCITHEQPSPQGTPRRFTGSRSQR